MFTSIHLILLRHQLGCCFRPCILPYFTTKQLQVQVFLNFLIFPSNRLIEALRLSTEAQGLVEVAKDQRLKAEAEDSNFALLRLISMVFNGIPYSICILEVSKLSKKPPIGFCLICFGTPCSRENHKNMNFCNTQNHQLFAEKKSFTFLCSPN